MELPYAGNQHGHSMFISRPDYILIPQRASALAYVSDSASVSPVNVVAERKERVRGKAECSERGDECFLLFISEPLRRGCEVFLPGGDDILCIRADVLLSHIVPVVSCEFRKEG